MTVATCRHRSRSWLVKINATKGSKAEDSEPVPRRKKTLSGKNTICINILQCCPFCKSHPDRIENGRHPSCSVPQLSHLQPKAGVAVFIRGWGKSCAPRGSTRSVVVLTEISYYIEALRGRR